MAKSPLEHLWRCALIGPSAGRMPQKMENKDTNGGAHYLGWSLPELKYFYEKRKITASGHETTDTDSGTATSKDDYSIKTYILSTNHYQIELLTGSGPRSQKAPQDFPREYLQFCRKENRRLR